MDQEVEITQEKSIQKPDTNNVTSSQINQGFLFIGTQAGGVYSYELEGKEEKLKKIGSHRGKVTCLLCMPKYKLLLSGSSDHQIKVFDFYSCELLQTLTHHRNSVLVMNVIGDVVISGSIDRTFKFFQVDKEKLKYFKNPWLVEQFFFRKLRKYHQILTSDWITTIWSNKKPKLYPYDVLIGDNAGNLIYLNSIPDVNDEDSVTNIEFVKKQKLSVGIFSVEATDLYLIVTFINNVIILFDQEGKIQFKTIRWKENISHAVYNFSYNELLIICGDSLSFYCLNKNRVKKRRRLLKKTERMSVKLAKINMINENKIAVQTINGFLIYNVKRTVPFKNYLAHNDPVIGLTIFKDSGEFETYNSIISCGQDSYLAFWIASKYELKLNKKVLVKTKPKQEDLFTYTFFPPNTIITGHNSGYVAFFNRFTNKQNSFKPHRNTCCSLVVFKYKVKSYFLVSGDFDGVIVLCNLTYYHNLDRDPIFEKKKRCSQTSIVSLNYYPQGELIIVSDATGKIKFFSLALKKKKEIHAHDQSCNCLQVVGSYLFSASSDTLIKQWNLETFKLVQVFEYHKSPINLLYKVQDESHFISTDREGNLIEFNYEKSKVVRTFAVKRGLEITSINQIERRHIFCGTTSGTSIFDKFGEEDELLLKTNKQKSMPVHMQTATDESGRRRFHGAFTGGFSAGYFNTVGSEEGFTPKSFVSSRSNRASVKQNIMKIMDEEDKDQILGAKKLIMKTGLGEDVSPSVLSNSTNIGERLLKVMGWKQGQGVGSAQVVKKKRFGPSLPAGFNRKGGGGDISMMENEVVEKNVLPKDIDVVTFHVKTDLFGIGFARNPLTQRFSKGIKQKKQGSQGFGVGVFEEEEEFDVYNEKEDDGFFPKFQKSKEKEKFKKEDDKMNLDDDGDDVLAGFVKQRDIVDTQWLFKKYPPPVEIDESAPVFESDGGSIPNVPNFVAKNPEKRREILGEKSLPGGYSNQKYFTTRESKDMKKLFGEMLSSRFTKPEQDDKKIESSGLRDMSRIIQDDDDDAFKPKEKPTKSRPFSLKIDQNEAISVAKLEWRPSSILCRRFNIPNPYPNSDYVGTMTSKSSFLSFVGGPVFKSSEERSEEKEIELLIESDDEEDGSSAVARPTMSLFKSIFENDDGIDESEDVEMEDKVPATLFTNTNARDQKEKFVFRPTEFTPTQQRSNTKMDTTEEVIGRFQDQSEDFPMFKPKNRAQQMEINQPKKIGPTIGPTFQKKSANAPSLENNSRTLDKILEKKRKKKKKRRRRKKKKRDRTNPNEDTPPPKKIKKT